MKDWQDFFKEHGDNSLQYLYYFEKGPDSVKVEELYQAFEARLVSKLTVDMSVETEKPRMEFIRQQIFLMMKCLRKLGFIIKPRNLLIEKNSFYLYQV